MKKIIIAIVLFPTLCFGQNVTFNKNVYTTTDLVEATLLSKTDGVTNEIRAQSIGTTPAGKLILGANSRPGYYQVDFKFGPKTEKYFVLILPPSVNAGTNPPAIRAVSPANAKFNLYLDKAIEYYKEKGSVTSILNRVAAKYATAYPVQGPVTVVACIGVPFSGGNLAFAFTCKEGLTPMARDLGIFFLESLNEELYARKKYSKEDYQFYKDNLKLIQYFINAYTADGVLDTFATIAPTVGNDTAEHLGYGASIADQFVKKYQFILKFRR